MNSVRHVFCYKDILNVFYAFSPPQAERKFRFVDVLSIIKLATHPKKGTLLPGTSRLIAIIDIHPPLVA